MAPALTEPLSPTNKLSTSTSAASPRPVICNNPNNSNTLLNKLQNNSDQKYLSSQKEQQNNVENLSSAQRRTSKRCAFQSAFEEVIKKFISTEEENTPSPANKRVTRHNKKLQQLSVEELKTTKEDNLKVRSEKQTRSKTAKSAKQSLGIDKNTEGISNGPDDNLSPETVATAATVTNEIDETTILWSSATTASQSLVEEEEHQKQMEPLQATVQESPQLAQETTETKDDERNVQQIKDNNQLNTLDSDIEEAINKSLNKDEKQIILKFDEFQHINCDDDSQVKTPICDDNGIKKDSEFSQTLISTGENNNNIFDENFVTTQSQNEHGAQEQMKLETIPRQSPPTTPTSSSLQQQTTPLSVTLTPQSTSSGPMSLQKDFIKDNSEMDQVLGDMDLLQVLKGFDSTTAGGEAALCDLAGSLGLFNDVDVMSYEEIVTPIQKNLENDEIRNEIEKRQQQLQRKCDFLLRRLRKIQARTMGKHTSEEISGLFEWTNRLVRRKNHEQLPEITYEEDKHRPVTQTAMRSLFRRIDSVSTAQHGIDFNTPPTTINNSQKKNKISGLNTSTTHSLVNDIKKSSIIQKFDEKSTDEIGHISGMLQTEMREVQRAFDSDITASSSGGDSADEMVTYNNQIQQPLSISKRVAWKWARDRSAIASRWIWLCAQISDLEYRIRQHNELYTQIKKNKGGVTFEKSSNMPSTSTADIVAASSNIDGVNGYRSSTNKKTETDSITASPPPNGAFDQTSGSCRTRPFQRNWFRKRKLLQTANVHTVSKKAARPSTVKCGCQWPLHPCALCTGRPDPTAPRDLPDTMTLAERVSLLDSSFHPVLSFPQDVANSIHIEATLQMSDTQNRIIRNSTKLTTKGSLTSLQKIRDDKSSTSTSSKKHRTHQKINRKQQDLMSSLLGGSGTTTSSANKQKTKNRKNSEFHSGSSATMTTTSSHQQHNSASKAKHRKLSSTISTTLNSNNSSINNNSSGSAGINSNMNGFQNAFAESLNLNCDNLDGAANGLYPRSKNSSPIPTSGQHHNTGSNYKYERMLERRSRNSYDIDNIVIPYSVAAATRVEILPYKEIPTPKWRVIRDDEDDFDEPNLEINGDKMLPTILENETSLSYKENTGQNVKTESTTVELLPPLSATSCVSNDDKNETKETDEKNLLNSTTVSKSDEMIDEESKTMNLDEIENIVEDISEEAIQMRHERALLEERKKFSTFLKFPWSTRSRANRRIDSRAESSGANTPDPTSPAPNTPSVEESIPSPATPLTPMITNENADENINQNNPPTIYPPVNNIYYSAARRERKRTVSAKKEKENKTIAPSDDQRRSSSPDQKEIIPPFEPLQFPLSDDLYETMLKMMPNHHQIIDECLKLTNTTTEYDMKLMELSSTTSSIINNSSNNSSRKNSFTSSHNINDLNNALNNNISNTNIFSIPKQNTFVNNYKNNTVNDNSVYDSVEHQLRLLEDSDTDSVESGLQDEDPNDPEWMQPV